MSVVTINFISACGKVIERLHGTLNDAKGVLINRYGEDTFNQAISNNLIVENVHLNHITVLEDQISTEK